MSNFIIGLLCGIFTGAFIGVALMAILQACRTEEEDFKNGDDKID